MAGMTIGVGMGDSIVPKDDTPRPYGNVLDTIHDISIFRRSNVRVFTNARSRHFHDSPYCAIHFLKDFGGRSMLHPLMEGSMKPLGRFETTR